MAKQCTHTYALCVACAAAEYDWRLPLPNPRPDTLTLCVSPPGYDYPMQLPAHIRQCGPILRTAGSVDAELLAWLNQSDMRTVLVAFGTHFRMDEQCAQNLLVALCDVLHARQDIQVLWKLGKYGKYDLPGLEKWGDRIKLVEWLESEPVDIMRTGKIAALVHHGGSNSYHEALAYVEAHSLARFEIRSR